MIDKIISAIKLVFIPCEGNKYRPKFLESRVLFYYVISLLVFKGLILYLFIYFPRTIFLADITESALISMVNKQRESLGIQILKENSKLDEAAQLKAENMMENGYFAHQSPGGITPWYWFKEAGYGYKFAGENLAIGFFDSEEVYQAWLNSVSHKKNLLNPNYSETGIAVLTGSFQGNETNVVVQLFGAPIFPAKEIMIQKQTAVQSPVSEKNSSSVGTVLSAFSDKSDQSNLASNLFVYNYYDLVQKATYGSLIFVIISFLINIFVRFDIQHKDLILKTLVLVLLLVSFIFVDKELIIGITPHDFRIY